ncbi:uncharacterized protein HMPREF1541_07302 [Cyphellophora europaea CBS 101466]|uniref:Uncharacterized protein n=1 Tax=Cyphellophora europaea (strain CBS 101466) TaxID=1220924 RepID=W2RPM1_CYPE1|nr:uncharacterized protein HMPREF1541_07302 [Cyphellophora europaea CBS 101466]ETN37679.1 hypothetical protein HMPREF1541_07302 [Cyphellophora europaea CBS 101466]
MSNELCRVCKDIDIGSRKLAKEHHNIMQWRKAGKRHLASIEKAENVIERLKERIDGLESSRVSKTFEPLRTTNTQESTEGSLYHVTSVAAQDKSPRSTADLDIEESSRELEALQLTKSTRERANSRNNSTAVGNFDGKTSVSRLEKISRITGISLQQLLEGKDTLPLPESFEKRSLKRYPCPLVRLGRCEQKPHRSFEQCRRHVKSHHESFAREQPEWETEMFRIKIEDSDTGPVLHSKSDTNNKAIAFGAGPDRGDQQVYIREQKSCSSPASVVLNAASIGETRAAAAAAPQANKKTTAPVARRASQGRYRVDRSTRPSSVRASHDPKPALAGRLSWDASKSNFACYFEKLQCHFNECSDRKWKTDRALRRSSHIQWHMTQGHLTVHQHQILLEADTHLRDSSAVSLAGASESLERSRDSWPRCLVFLAHEFSSVQESLDPYCGTPLLQDASRLEELCSLYLQRVNRASAEAVSMPQAQNSNFLPTAADPMSGSYCETSSREASEIPRVELRLPPDERSAEISCLPSEHHMPDCGQSSTAEPDPCLETATRCMYLQGRLHAIQAQIAQLRNAEIALQDQLAALPERSGKATKIRRIGEPSADHATEHSGSFRNCMGSEFPAAHDGSFITATHHYAGADGAEQDPFTTCRVGAGAGPRTNDVNWTSLTVSSSDKSSRSHSPKTPPLPHESVFAAGYNSIEAEVNVPSIAQAKQKETVEAIWKMPLRRDYYGDPGGPVQYLDRLSASDSQHQQQGGWGISKQGAEPSNDQFLSFISYDGFGGECPSCSMTGYCMLHPMQQDSSSAQ